MHLTETSTTAANTAHQHVFVDGVDTFSTFLGEIDKLIWMAPGSHTIQITAMDKAGAQSSLSFPVTVVPPQAPSVGDLQSLPNWEGCSAVFPPGTPRAGQLCAAGNGEAFSTMTPNQANPSMDGKSTLFNINGPNKYTNFLWYLPLGGGSNVTKFTYDVFFMVDNGLAPQALEFDLNQTFNGTRWTWGTECNFNGSHAWDIWNGGIEKWMPTNVPCTPFPSMTWIHLVWNFERVGNQMHYISISINGVVTPVDVFLPAQPNWPIEDINVAFQMDMNANHVPYNVWLDKLRLTAQ